ncbi:hypothetical protein TNCV_1406451 [Trichonephila clavipes]|nr:hypothetical protein TNCV_1406451 [Trichonephila clavipes]
MSRSIVGRMGQAKGVSQKKKEQVLRRIRAKGTRVLSLIADHLSDLHLDLGEIQIEMLKRVGRKLLHIESLNKGKKCQVPVATTCDQEVQRWSPYRSMRKGHNKENQLDPEEAERNNLTTPTSRDKEGQAEGIPEAEKISNNIARREHKERSVPNSTLLES